MALFRRPATDTLPNDNDDRPADDRPADDTATSDSAPADNGDDNGDYARVPTPAAASPAARDRVATPAPPPEPSAPPPFAPKVVDARAPAPKPVDPPADPVVTDVVGAAEVAVDERAVAAEPVGDEPVPAKPTAAAGGDDSRDRDADGERDREAHARAHGDADGDDGDGDGDGADIARRWHELMVSFVDVPSEAVDAAQALVSDELARVVRVLEGERDKLRAGTTDAPSTEDLRLTLRGLRTLSERLQTIAK